MTTSNPTTVLRAKAEGAFIALAAGDALGWPQELVGAGRGRQRRQATTEFREWERKSGGRYYAHTEVIRAGEYSDDTQLTLAVARCRILAGSAWWAHLSRNELPLWTIYERGGGGATKRAAESWLRGVAPWKQTDTMTLRRYFDAGGNGVAMRVLPHVVYCAADDDPASFLRDVIADGVATHGHPRALVGAVAYAYAAWWLLRSQHTLGFGELVTMLLDNSTIWGATPVGSANRNGWSDAASRVLGDYDKIWHQVVGEMVKLLMQVREGLAAGSIADDDGVLNALGALGSAKGAGTVSAATAIYLTARYAAQPVQGVLRGAFAVGADTDTIAAMTGALLGVLAGTDWLPREWFSVQDCDYLRQIANKLVVREVLNEGGTSRSIGNKDVDVLLESLISGSRDDLDFGGVRRVRVVGSRAPVSVSRSATVQTWHLQASDGQTIHLAKVSRKTKDNAIATEDKGHDIVPQAALPWLLEASDDHAIRVTKAGRKAKDDATASEVRPHDVPPKTTPPREERKPEARAAGVKLTVANLAASTGFYEGVLGLSPSKRTPKFVSFGPISLVDGPYAVGLSGGAVTLEKSTGRNRVEIYVSDIDAIHVRLLEHRVRLVQPITVMPWGERSLHCLDPDGNVVELVERRAR